MFVWFTGFFGTIICDFKALCQDHQSICLLLLWIVFISSSSLCKIRLPVTHKGEGGGISKHFCIVESPFLNHKIIDQNKQIVFMAFIFIIK